MDHLESLKARFPAPALELPGHLIAGRRSAQRGWRGKLIHSPPLARGTRSKSLMPMQVLVRILP